MNRREFFAAMSAAGAMVPMPSSGAPAELRSAAREAWLYSLPLMEMANVRYNADRGKSEGQRIGINVLAHNRELASPASRAVTSPNVDTLYSSAFIDLAGGPVTITLPPTGSRYISFAFMDMYTNNFCILGTHTTGGDGGTFTLVAPTAAAPIEAIRAPTPWVWGMVRVLVDGPNDYSAVHQVQDGIRVEAGKARAAFAVTARDAPWADYFASAQALLAENPPPVTDAALFHRIAPLGLGPIAGFNPRQFSAAEATEIEAGVADAKTVLRDRSQANVQQGWAYPAADVGNFDQDYVTRARVALGGLAALTRAEAMYSGAYTPDGEPLFDSAKVWLLHFPAGKLPPANAFWSLTLYQTEPDGRSFLAENPAHRYAIGDRTQGLKQNGDGSLDLWIGRNDPGGSRTSNWLPAPQSGSFRLSMRCFLPKPELLDGRYKYPPVVRVG